jgi:Na+/H+ antiporter NhaA
VSLGTRAETTSLREFLRTETAGAAVLLLAVATALAWANTDLHGYEAFWGTPVSVRVGGHGMLLTVRGWIDSGLMTFFFFVVGLEARREFDIGELRERSRLILPLAAGVCGMLLSVAVYLVVTAGTGAAHGWGAAMSTDTAFALGVLGTLGTRMPPRLRVFVLTLAIVDDFLSLVVIAGAYSVSVSVPALVTGLLVLAVILAVRAAGVQRGAVFLGLVAVAWTAFLYSGVDPVVVGLVVGLLTYAHPADRSDLRRATELYRSFREQPTPELERSLRLGIASAISPNGRLQRLFHPWTSFVIVPLFALANSGVSLDARQLEAAFTSPVTWGILLGYVLGKPVGILLGTVLVTRLSRGRVRTLVGWAALGAGGGLAAVGFTVSLLIATLAFHGPQLAAAKTGILCGIPVSFLLTWAITACVSLLPRGRRMTYLIGRAETIIDLQVPVDPDRDHIKGPPDALVTLVEYGDYECPHCGRAERVIDHLLNDLDGVRYVWRHLPLTDIHPQAQLAAEAAEVAGQAGRYWEMHALLLSHQGALRLPDLREYAVRVGLDAERFERSLLRHEGAARVGEDIESADLSGVAGTPTFFVNGRRFYGAYDAAALSAAVGAAFDRAWVKQATAAAPDRRPAREGQRGRRTAGR